MMGPGTQCCFVSFNFIGLVDLEKKNLEESLPIMGVAATKFPQTNISLLYPWLLHMQFEFD